MAFVNEDYQKSWDQILDTFGGADGGGSFARLRFFLEDAERALPEYADTSNQLLDIMYRFGRLIESINKRK